MSAQLLLSEREPQRRGGTELALKTHSSSVSSRQSYGVSSSRSLHVSTNQLLTVGAKLTKVNLAPVVGSVISNETSTTLSGAVECKSRQPSSNASSHGVKFGDDAVSLKMLDNGGVTPSNSTVVNHFITNDKQREGRRLTHPVQRKPHGAQAKTASKISAVKPEWLATDSTPPPSLVPRRCSLCERQLSGPEEPLRHKRMCPDKELLCPLLCGKLLRRGDVTRHVREEALEHDPLPIPSSTEYPEEHPTHVLAVVMNMFLECVKGGKGAGEQPTGDLRPRRICLSDRSVASSTASHHSSLGSTFRDARTEAAVKVSLNTQGNGGPAEFASTPLQAEVPKQPADLLQPNSRDAGDLYPAESQKTPPKDSTATVLLRNDLSDRSSHGNTSTAGKVVEPEVTQRATPAQLSPLVSGDRARTVGSGTSETNEKLFEDILTRMKLQHDEVEKIRERSGAYDISSAKETTRLEEIMDEVRNLVSALDAKNRCIHNDCKRLMGRASLAPSVFIDVLHSWRNLDRHWHEVRVILCDAARI